MEKNMLKSFQVACREAVATLTKEHGYSRERAVSCILRELCGRGNLSDESSNHRSTVFALMKNHALNLKQANQASLIANSFTGASSLNHWMQRLSLLKANPPQQLLLLSPPQTVHKRRIELPTNTSRAVCGGSEARKKQKTEKPRASKAPKATATLTNSTPSRAEKGIKKQQQTLLDTSSATPGTTNLKPTSSRKNKRTEEPPSSPPPKRGCVRNRHTLRTANASTSATSSTSGGGMN